MAPIETIVRNKKKDTAFWKENQGRFFNMSTTLKKDGGEIIGAIGNYLVTVRGNYLQATPVVSEAVGDGFLHRLNADSFGGRFYDSVEQWIRNADGGVRLVLQETEAPNWHVICMYDGRPEVEITKYPDGSDLDDDDIGGWYTGGNFGYAWNIEEPIFSEWSMMPQFPMDGEDEMDAYGRSINSFNDLMEVMSQGGEAPFVIDAGPQIKSLTFGE